MTTERVAVFRMECTNGHDFVGPQLGDMRSYGEFLAQSAGGSYAYANSWADPVWDEVEELVGTAISKDAVPWRDWGDYVQAAYAATFDAASDGPFRMGLPHCPTCGADVPTIFDNEAAVSVMEIPTIEHVAWAKLSPSVKRDLVLESLQSTAGDRVTFTDPD